MKYAVCGYGSLMIPDSFLKTTCGDREDQECKNILFLPARARCIVYKDINGQEKKYFAKRVFSYPRISVSLKRENIENNERAVLTLEVSEDSVNNCNYYNIVIGLYVDEKQLKKLMDREYGYDVFYIKKEDLFFVYDDHNIEFLAKFFMIHRDKISELGLRIEKDTSFIDVIKEIEKLPRQQIRKIIRKLLPERILVFGMLINKDCKTDVFREIIELGKQVLDDLWSDDPQFILNRIVAYRREMEKIELSNHVKEEIQNLKNMDINSLFNKLRELIKSGEVSKKYLKAALYILLDKAIRRYGIYCIKRLLVDEFKMSLYPIKNYYRTIITYLASSWGREFIIDFLETTYLYNGQKLSNYDDPYIREFMESNWWNIYLRDMEGLGKPELNWIFTRNLQQSVNPIKIALKIFNAGLASSIGYFEYINEKINREVLIRSDISINHQFRIYGEMKNYLRILTDMINPSVLNDKFISIIYLGRLNINVIPKDPIFEDCVAKADLFIIVFSNGIINIIYRFKNIDEILSKVPINYVFSWWWEKHHPRTMKFTLDLFNNQINYFEGREYEDLSDFSQDLVDKIKKLCKLDKPETSYRWGLNHPILHLALVDSAIDQDLPLKDLENIVLEKYRDKITQIITAYSKYKRMKSIKLRNISSFDKFLVFTDFNTLVIHKDKNYQFMHKYELDYFLLLFTYIMTIRLSLVITNFELDKLLGQVQGLQYLKKLSRIHFIWIKNYTLYMPDRVLRSIIDMEFANNLFKIFQLDKLLSEIDARKEEIDDYFAKKKSESDEWAFLFINLLLSGSLAFEIVSNILSYYIAPSPLINLLAWLAISAIIFIVTRITPKFYLRS